MRINTQTSSSSSDPFVSTFSVPSFLIKAFELPTRIQQESIITISKKNYRIQITAWQTSLHSMVHFHSVSVNEYSIKLALGKV